MQKHAPRPASVVLLLLLWALILPGGCNDRILPASDGDGDVWGSQQIVFSDVSSTDNLIVTIAVNSDGTSVPLGLSGQIFYPPMGGHILYGVVNSMDNTDLRLRGPGKDESIVTENYSFFLDGAAALTFDGNDVAYVAKQQLWGAWMLYLHETDGKKTTVIDSQIGDVSTMLFSRDGRFLAVNTMRTGDTEERTYIYDRVSGTFTATVERAIKEAFLLYSTNWCQWMPGGKLLYPGYDYSGNPGLYTIAGEGGYAHLIDTGLFSFPAPSNAGTRIAFIRENTLWIMNDDGSGKRALVSADPSRSETMMAPQWSPDDSKIMISSVVTDGNKSIIALVTDVVDVATGRRKSLTNMAYPPFWLK